MTTWSEYQSDIFEWIEDGTGNAVVEAVAGSGKTTTLVEAANRIDGRGLFLAFNKSIAVELGERLAGTRMTARTVHSLGNSAIYRAFGKVPINGDKYRAEAKAVLDEVLVHGVDLNGWRPSVAALDVIDDEGRPTRAITRLVDLMRLTRNERATPSDLVDMAAEAGLTWDPALDGLVYRVGREALERGFRRSKMVIDFTDMVWLPLVMRLPVHRFRWLFVDECQDLNRAQQELISKALAPEGRLLAVGDRRQAIYGFAGADASSFQRMTSSFHADVLPLSVCYRCPTTVLSLARKLVPQIEDGPTAAPGSVDRVKPSEVGAVLTAGCMVLGRVNSGLVAECYRAIKAGRRAYMRGRAIGTGLVTVVKRVEKALDDTWGNFADVVKGWQDGEHAKLDRTGADDGDPRREIINDKAECLAVLHELADPPLRSVADMEALVDRLFDDSDPGAICFSSIHRAKGLEAPHVIIIDTEKLPHPKAVGAVAQEQERNLVYVAITRAQERLTWAGEPPEMLQDAGRPA